MNKLETAVRDFVRSIYQPRLGQPLVRAVDDAEWLKFRALGTRLWLDTGDVEEATKLWNSAFDALTTNNTLLNKEIQKGQYDHLVTKAAEAIRAAAPDISLDELILEIAFVLNACHGLRLVAQFDAFVSVELHTDVAHDVARTVRYGRRLHAICPDRFIIKVPLTPAGYLAAGQLVRSGVPVNFTLGFSARQNYLAALLTQPTYCNVFLGRLNSFVADNGLGDGQNVGEKATLATQRWLLALRQAGRSHTRLIAASIRAGSQLPALAGVDVQTIPPAAAAAYRAKPQLQLTSQVTHDPPTDWNAPWADSLWSVPASFQQCVERLLQQDVDSLTPEALQVHFEKAGLGDFMPRWTAADVQQASLDGKIPVLKHWLGRLASGKIGLDALMNLAALQSFTTDQSALDNRIRSLLGASS